LLEISSYPEARIGGAKRIQAVWRTSPVMP